jgi:hypothetical protein
MATVLPPVRAGFDRATAQVLEVFEFNADGVHRTEVTNTGATRETLAVAELPFKEMVIAAALSA